MSNEPSPRRSRSWRDARAMRRTFLRSALHGLWVTWPIISAHMALMIILGAAVGVIEGWHATDGIYFSFVTGYTVGYGHLAPTHLGSRIISVLIATIGISMTGVLASVGVRALNHAMPPADWKDE